MSSHLPNGTVTFLFTDIEGHTRLWQAYPQTMVSALAAHDRLLAQAVRTHRGHIVKTTGDGLFAVFDTAIDALQAAVDGQLALADYAWEDTGPLRVRMALHTGAAHIREDDYFGTAVIRTARIMSLAAGGQILVSGTSAALLQDHLPADIGLAELGEHGLKDLPGLVTLWQVQHKQLPQDFPVLRTAKQISHNLPRQLTSFVGRNKEVTEVANLLTGRQRLVTLTGPGGTGKTRLALQVASELLSDYPDGLWLIELAALKSEAEVHQAITSVLKLGEPRNVTYLDLLASYLRARKTLLILDNCEHLLDACARLGDHLLHYCDQLCLLATSREPLGIGGETTYTVPTLELPQAGNVTAELLRETEAGQLFEERAKAVDPRFAVSDGNAMAISLICQRLDGIPLAIELAAARINVFNPEQLLQRLDDCFRILTGGSRSAMPRQQTLRALIDWSYQLLTEDEKELLRRLSVFSGGWTLESAEAVAGEHLDVLISLPQLINKSLVTVDNSPLAETRYSLLETIHRFGLEKLQARGEEILMRRAHLAHFHQLAQDKAPQTASESAQAPWIEFCQLEQGNFRAALNWAQIHDPWKALEMCGSLAWFWARRGSAREGHSWLVSALEKYFQSVPPEKQTTDHQIMGMAQLGLCQVLTILGEFNRSLEAAAQALHHFRQIGEDHPLLPFTLGMLGFIATIVGDLETAAATADETQALAMQMSDKAALGIGYFNQSSVLLLRDNNPEAAQQAANAGFDYTRESGSAWGQVIATVTLGRVTYLAGYATADYRRAFGDLIDSFIALEDYYFANVCRSELAHAERLSGNHGEADTLYRQTIEVWRELGQKAAVAHQLECFAFLRLAEQRPELAARLLGAAERLREDLQAQMVSIERVEYEQQHARLRTTLSPDLLQKFWQEGRLMTIDEAIELALTT